MSKDNDCTETKEVKQELGADTSKLVYRGNEKLTFIDSNTTDTYTFVGQGYQISSHTGYSSYECPVEYIMEDRRLEFKDSVRNEHLYTVIGFVNAGDLPCLQIGFKDWVYGTFLSDLSKPYKYDSLRIRNKTYYNVDYFRFDTNPDVLGVDGNKYGCYYNLTEGLLKMETKDGHIWELVKIE